MWQSCREGFTKVLEREFCAINWKPPAETSWILFTALEGTVADELGVDATIPRVVDIFMHKAVHGRRGGVPPVAWTSRPTAAQRAVSAEMATNSDLIDIMTLVL